MTPERGTYDTGTSVGTAVLPDPPRYWSYSALTDYEKCPTHYLLARAGYPQLWERKGFPPKPTVASLAGQTVHQAIETIVRELAKAGFPSSDSADFVEVLRRLGGFSAVVEGAATQAMGTLEGNPRTSLEYRNRLQIKMEETLSHCRATVQSILSRFELGDAPKTRQERGVFIERMADIPRSRASIGIHPEYTLTAERLRLTGRLDLLQVGTDGVAIIDYKTGEPSPEHEDQVRFYLVLWCNDEVANPDRIPVRRLILSYPDGDMTVSVPLSDVVSTIETELVRRIAEADSGVRTGETVGRPGGQCTGCLVRGICQDYWAMAVPHPSRVNPQEWFDLEGTLDQAHASRSRWIVADSGERLLLRYSTESLAHHPSGQRVRMLGVLRDVDPDDGTMVAIVTPSTEILGSTIR